MVFASTTRRRDFEARFFVIFNSLAVRVNAICWLVAAWLIDIIFAISSPHSAVVNHRPSADFDVVFVVVSPRSHMNPQPDRWRTLMQVPAMFYLCTQLHRSGSFPSSSSLHHAPLVHPEHRFNALWDANFCSGDSPRLLFADPFNFFRGGDGDSETRNGRYSTATKLHFVCQQWTDGIKGLMRIVFIAE